MALFKLEWAKMTCCEKFGSVILMTGAFVYVVGEMTYNSLSHCTRSLWECCKESWEVYDPYGIKETFREWDARVKREQDEKNKGQTHSQE